MNTPRILSTSIAALTAFLFVARTALAGSATWLASGATGDWNAAANWTPATVPNGPANTATFGLSDQFIPFAFLTANTEVGGIVFNAGASAFQIGSNNVTFTVSGTSITNNSAALQVLSAGGGLGRAPLPEQRDGGERQRPHPRRKRRHGLF